MNAQNDFLNNFLYTVENYRQLSASERLTILRTYFFSDRKLLRSAGLNKNEKKIFRKLFIELHVNFYLKIIKGPKYVKISRLILNFLFLRAKENLRLVLISYKPYNLTAFVHGIRSQIEINALLIRFIKDNDKYFEEYFSKSEERKSIDKLINIQSLIDKMDDNIIDYRVLYMSYNAIMLSEFRQHYNVK